MLAKYHELESDGSINRLLENWVLSIEVQHLGCDGDAELARLVMPILCV